MFAIFLGGVKCLEGKCPVTHANSVNMTASAADAATTVGSGTFRIPLLFSGLRRFVYLVQMSAAAGWS